MTKRKIRWQRLRSFKLKKVQVPKISISKIGTIKLEKPANWLDSIVTILLKLGTLFLLTLLIVFFVRIFKSEGYVMESFNVPENFEMSGYDGFVVARKIQDEVYSIKSFPNC